MSKTTKPFMCAIHGNDDVDTHDAYANINTWFSDLNLLHAVIWWPNLRTYNTMAGKRRGFINIRVVWRVTPY